MEAGQGCVGKRVCVCGVHRAGLGMWWGVGATVLAGLGGGWVQRLVPGRAGGGDREGLLGTTQTYSSWA